MKKRDSLSGPTNLYPPKLRGQERMDGACEEWISVLKKLSLINFF